ncbi:Hypothetical predicted protein [Mytilus galloprovincialis]|uniref:SCAN box domain-containing protein n=1 Tax=Mytilus galloprovincialis TaxID=29158 RepID=A0A8B6DBV3_MYTGA|nr:Hypothetical predicted protein [Mytilus galloprovincialis]
MLQSVFEGKAAEIYSALPSEKSSDYDTVKQEVLKAYELVPEAYRQKFRSYKKFDSQTYVEFAREKEDLFDKWLTSKKTDNNFDNLRQLMLLEEFKQCVHLDLKTHLDDKTVESIHDAAPIKILRDTGASQSLLLEGVLPLSEKTSVGASVLLQGVELGCIDVPLHRIYLKSDLITGPVVVGVRPNLPVEGVTLLLGNDLARNKVVAEPIVTSEPVVDVKSPEDDAELYPACVVTRAMARKQQNENLQEDKFDYMDLSDTFIADIEGPGKLRKGYYKTT